MRADLHVHSSASDGILAPAEVVDLAVAVGIDVLAIADHDTVAGLAEARAAAEDTSLTLVPAVELSAGVGDASVHVLGYFIDPDDERLLAHLADLRAARLRRARTMVDALAAEGFEVALDDVLRFARGASVGRPHVARALAEKGLVRDSDDAFTRLIGKGRPCYVAKDSRTPAEVVSVIRDAGGLAVLAHPGITRIDDAIPALVAEGLSGIEAYHSEHTPDQAERYAALARRFGLLVTGGSDYHGPGLAYAELGSADVPPAAVAAFLAAGSVG